MNQIDIVTENRPNYLALWAIAGGVAWVASWAFWVVVIIGVVAIVGIDIAVSDLNSMTSEQAEDYAEELIGKSLGALLALIGGMFVVTWLLMAVMYKVLIAAMLKHSVSFVLALGAAIAGFFAGFAGWAIDAVVGGLTMGLIGAAANGALAALVLRAGARPRA